jgi:hypothetical protein
MAEPSCVQFPPTRPVTQPTRRPGDTRRGVNIAPCATPEGLLRGLLLRRRLRRRLMPHLAAGSDCHHYVERSRYDYM